MKPHPAVLGLLVSLLAACAASGGRQSAAPAAVRPVSAAPTVPPEPSLSAGVSPPAFAPLPADRTVSQSMVLAGKTFDYSVTVGSLSVLGSHGEKIADVVFTAYIHPDPTGNRPVTFAINGGPGAASAFLNFGAIGPQFVAFGGQEDNSSDAAQPVDNPATWLAFTDLVFIDPVGSGYSRSLLTEEQTKKHFYSVGPDIEYLSDVITEWLSKNSRMTSPKYIVGESYGGFRVPRLAHRLQTTSGVGVSGMVMVSPLLDWGDRMDRDFSPISWIVTLPSMAAVKLEREGNLAGLREVEDYARGEFAVDLLKGRSDPAATQRIVAHVAAITGLDSKTVMEMGGRIDIQTYLRQEYRDHQRIASIYDATVSSWDPFPFDVARRTGDPILQGMMAPLSTAMVEFLTHSMGWPVDRPYHLYDRSISQQWDWGWGPDKPPECVEDLRQALALDAKMQALVAYGYTDLITPYFAARLALDQLPDMGNRDRVRLALYRGGHMFYRQLESRMALSRDAAALYARRTAQASPEGR
jgi:carboxypeptidase C (cathepsin A)